MRASTLVVVVLGVVLLGLGGLTAWRHMEAEAFTSNLQLAYDASLPGDKAKYVREFIGEAEDAGLPEYGSWVVKRANLKTSNQLDILRGLAVRCEQLAAVDPSALGYSQGMMQLTQDEFEYTLTNTMEFFKRARQVSFGWVQVNGVLVALVLFVLAVLVRMALSPKHRRVR